MCQMHLMHLPPGPAVMYQFLSHTGPLYLHPAPAQHPQHPQWHKTNMQPVPAPQTL